MRCVITGVAGFVGSSIADELLSQGHEVIGIDCFTDYYARHSKEQNIAQARSNNRFRLVEGNLLQQNLVELLEGAEWVFHQAAQAGVRASWGKDFSIYTDNNILATQRLLEAATNSAVKETLRKIVYASSSSVYGDAEALPTIETMTPQPISPYGVSKLAAEHLMVLYAKEFGVPSASLRYFTVYGPRQRPDMAFNKFIKAGLEGRSIEVYGNGEQSRDFTFISDIVKSNIQAAESDTKQLVFNVGGGSRVALRSVLDKIGEILGSPLRVNYQPRQLGDALHTAADTTRARVELGYVPQVSLVEGLQAEATWLQSRLT